MKPLLIKQYVVQTEEKTADFFSYLLLVHVCLEKEYV